MPDIQAHLPDGKTVLHFPDGTDPSVIDRVVKGQIAPASPYSEAGAAANPPIAPVDPTAIKGMPPSQFEGDVAKGMGFDPNAIADRRPGMHQWAEMLNQAMKGAGSFGSSVVKDPYHITDPISGMATGIETAAKNRSPGQMVGALSNVAMGMEAVKPTAISGPSAAELKSGVADAAYKRGLGVSESLKSASAKIHEAVGQGAQSFVKKVDEKFPEGAIDPKPIMDSVNQVKADVVKTPEKYPAGLASMLEPEPSPLEQASVFRGAGKAMRGGGPQSASDAISVMEPKARARYLESLSPEERAIVEQPSSAGQQSGMWTAEQAKQWRTKIGSALTKTTGPMKVVLQNAYDNLTQQMRKAGDESGALKDFTDYNNLHKKHMSFLNDSIVKKIMGGETSDETLGPLSKPENMAHVKNLLDDWDKYGIKTEDLEKEGADYGKAKSLMEKKRFKWFPGGTLGGAVGGHMLGLPWGVGAGGGLLLDRWLSGAGKASKFIEKSKVSPFYQAGESKAAAISRGFEDLPEISSSKVAIKKASGK